jgi:ribosomal protein S18 acetylase RimI-like enzyme
MLTGLRYMKDKGMKNAVVRTGADNHPAIALYESVGFNIADDLYRYVKRL